MISPFKALLAFCYLRFPVCFIGFRAPPYGFYMPPSSKCGLRRRELLCCASRGFWPIRAVYSPPYRRFRAPSFYGKERLPPACLATLEAVEPCVVIPSHFPPLNPSSRLACVFESFPGLSQERYDSPVTRNLTRPPH